MKILCNLNLRVQLAERTGGNLQKTHKLPGSISSIPFRNITGDRDRTSPNLKYKTI